MRDTANTAGGGNIANLEKLSVLIGICNDTNKRISPWNRQEKLACFAERLDGTIGEFILGSAYTCSGMEKVLDTSGDEQ